MGTLRERCGGLQDTTALEDIEDVPRAQATVRQLS